MKLALGQKRIGLLQREGMAIVVLNPGHKQLMNAGPERRVSAVFARRASRQGRNLPPPDLVLASSSSPALAGAAFSLSSFYGVPLILEVRAMERSFVDFGPGFWKRIFTSPRRRRALKAYLRADSIIVPSPEMALTVAPIPASEERVAILSDELDYSELFHEFSKILTPLLSDGKTERKPESHLRSSETLDR